jgi:hypothetical protein
MTSPLGPWTRDVGIKLEMRIFKVKKICRLIKLTSASLLLRTRKGMESSMVTIRIRGWPPVVSVDWLASAHSDRWSRVLLLRRWQVGVRLSLGFKPKDGVDVE